jgi:4-diphosphocytidyl-2-C-methyl-D-erythritol kinase
VTLATFAPAKINLYLHVGPLAPDGYHPLSSLMVFADIGDHVSIEAADALSIELDGPFAQALLDQDLNSNLVTKAVYKILAAAGGPMPPFRLLLNKNLPVGSGMGGGSSDAGATLRLLRSALTLKISDQDLQDMAASLGSDGAACLWGEPVLAQGRGEQISPITGLPPLHAVLVNPSVSCSTGAVFAAYDAAGAGGDAWAPDLSSAFTSLEETAAFLSYCRNDLEAPAIALCPEIAEVLAALRYESETLLARMSGSGGTCFGVFADDTGAGAAAARIAVAAPRWWVVAAPVLA